MRRWFDRITGRVTMYRLVTLLLAILAAASVVLSAIGQLSFDPLELLASAAVAIGSTLIANRVLALVFRAATHSESSIITGLLLFFLFWPSLLPADLLTLALASVLATASKYLLAWRGRHILNPAAAGATLVAVLQFGSATWWVATSALLPFTLVAAFLVLYRTRRLPMALVFVVVSGIILSTRLATNGQDIADAVVTTFTSYPVLFFVGFMLSEPLTLPPRRWQQLVIAAIAGVLFTIPYNLGPVFLSFEFTLVIVNVLAFLAGQRRGIALDYLGKRQVTPTAWEFSFRPEQPVTFRPGQYMELTVPHRGQDARGTRRLFSISSPPTPDGPISFGLRMSQPASSFKRSLLELEPGARIRATTVGGDFLLPRDATKPVLLVAGGIGVTPFLSQLAHDRAVEHDRDAVLVYQVSSNDELAYSTELANERVLLVSPEVPGSLPAAWRWIGAGPITSELLTAEIPDAASRLAFVSGAPSMVNETRATLRCLGVRRVTTDYFSGY